MKMFRNTILAAAALASAIGFSVSPAFAGSVVLCSPATDTQGSRRVTNPNTSVSYTLNGIGCGVIGSADVGYFLSQGYSLDSPFRSVVASGTANNFSAVIPAGAYIRDIIFQETSGAAVTGGMFVGSTATTSDVVSVSVAVGSKGLGVATDVGIAKKAFSATAPQTIFFGAFGSGGSFNGAAVTATVVYGIF